jgi:two-component system, chemotaxis family, response regulator Rcp1
LLHVEDNEAEAYLFRSALFEYQIDVAVFRVCDGHGAVEFLTRKGIYTNAPIPDLVVLDLNLPRKNGHDVLRELRQESALQHLPVLMLTSSQQSADRDKALSLGANEYVCKLGSLDELSALMQ